MVDVYCVIDAYDVKSPGVQHAVRKLLCAGLRGKATQAQDIREAIDALKRALEDAESQQAEWTRVDVRV